MDIKELMLSGKMYNDLTDELVKQREQTVFFTNEYNRSFGQEGVIASCSMLIQSRSEIMC